MDQCALFDALAGSWPGAQRARPCAGLPAAEFVRPAGNAASTRTAACAGAWSPGWRGADSIDDMDLLRHGAMSTLFGGIRAPSTLGSHLLYLGNVAQLEKAGPASSWR